MNASNVLGSLIGACVDDVRTLQHESRFVDEARGSALMVLAAERERFLVELQKLGDVEDRRATGSFAELLREAARNAWVSAAGANNGDAIAACRHSRARTAAAYDMAMTLALPGDSRRVVAEHQQRLHAETDDLNRLQF